MLKNDLCSITFNHNHKTMFLASPVISWKSTELDDDIIEYRKIALTEMPISGDFHFCANPHYPTCIIWPTLPPENSFNDVDPPKWHFLSGKQVCLVRLCESGTLTGWMLIQSDCHLYSINKEDHKLVYFFQGPKKVYGSRASAPYINYAYTLWLKLYSFLEQGCMYNNLIYRYVAVWKSFQNIFLSNSIGMEAAGGLHTSDLRTSIIPQNICTGKA